MIWPVPGSYEKKTPAMGEPGGFWEFRGDRHHCGIDIYAPRGSQVLAFEDGIVVDMGAFTSPGQVDYWNETFFIVLMLCSGLFARYAELDASVLENDDIISEGQCIGHVEQVLNPDKIDLRAPEYVRQLCRRRHTSMLHLEILAKYSQEIESYLGGNCFQGTMPDYLLNPAGYLKSTEAAATENAPVLNASS